MFERKHYSRPLPEMLDGDDWEARNSGDLKKAYVDFKKKEFVVPFTYGPAGELVRAHEAMHVKITPRNASKDFSEQDFVTLQAFEDARVHQGLRIAGIPTGKGRVWKDSEISELLQESTPLRLSEAYFATKGLEEENGILNAINSNRPEVLPICEEVYEKYYAENERNGFLTSWEEQLEAIQELKKRLKKVETEEDNQKDKDGSAHGGSKNKMNITSSFTPGSTDFSESYDQEEMILPVITDEESEEIKNAINTDWFPEDRGQPPGKMEISTPRMDSVMKFKKIVSVKTTASDEGVIPSQMHRYATDMRVFTRKGRRRTDSAVLIDISGSMSLTDDQVHEIIKQCPHAIIAVYAGNYNAGVLRIIAHKGRYCSSIRGGERNLGHSNIVDVPAVEWLASRREKKKLWISDGIVTGISDSQLDSFYLRKLVSVIKRHNIIRVGNVKELLKSGVLIDRAFDDEKELSKRYMEKLGR